MELQGPDEYASTNEDGEHEKYNWAVAGRITISPTATI